MRMLIVTAACAALAGCVTEDPAGNAPSPAVAARHDAHCRSLLMQPGSLVYTQCRLAMSETLRETEDRNRQLFEGAGASLPENVAFALREDTFCNFNESTALSRQAGGAAALAANAYDQCADSRARLRQAVLDWRPAQAESLFADYERETLAANEATIVEARSYS